MGKRWAPQGVANDPTNLNQHWAKNVSRFKEIYMTCTGPNCKPGEMKPPEAPKAPEQKIQTPAVAPKISISQVAPHVQHSEPHAIARKNTTSILTTPVKSQKIVSDSTPAEYTVQSGDTLSAIARNNKTTVEELARANNITDPNRIQKGQKIKLPKR